MHHRIHIDDFHTMPATDNGRERKKLTVPGFDTRDGHRKRLPFLYVLDKQHHIFNLPLIIDEKIPKKSPSITG